MNYYKSDFDEIMAHKEKIDKQAAHDFINASRMMMIDPMLVMSLNKGLEKSVGLPMSLADSLDTTSNAIYQLVWEATAFFRSTVIHVTDENLIECLMDADIDAVMSDVHLPFPICEFVFPSTDLGIKDYVTSGSLIADESMFSAKKFWKFDWLPEKKEGRRLLHFTRLLTSDGVTDSQGVSWLRFDPSCHLDELPKPKIKWAEHDGVACKKLARLCMSLCLYLQTKEGESALIETPHKKREGIASNVARHYKKKQSFKIRNLITPALEYTSGSRTGTHASPKAHWRKFHMRSLRDKRYKRNPDGSVRVIFVKPALIGASDDEAIKSERRI